MNVDFTKLDKILTIVTSIEKIILVQTGKRWLSSQEAADYLGYSTDSIAKFVKNGEFITGEDYYKKRKKLMFDKHALDKRVTSDSFKQENQINELIDAIKADIP